MNILNKIMLSFGAMMLSLSAQAVAAAPVAPIVDAPVAAEAAAPAAAPTDAAPAKAAAKSLPGYTPMDATTAKVVGQPHQKGVDFQEQYTENGQRAKWLNNSILLPMIIAISLFVLFLLLVVIVRFRKAANPVPSKTTHNLPLEILWTAIPALMLLVLAFPSLDLLAKQFKPAPENAVTIKATGYQWYWTYTYPDHGGFEVVSNMLKEENEVAKGERFRTDADGPDQLAVDNRLVVPAGVPLRFQITAADVIHSFAVPSLWFKLDAVPGRLNEKAVTITKPGLYFGQCSELCGVRHGYMPIAIEALPPAQFAAWVKAQGGKMPAELKAEAAAKAAADKAAADKAAADAKAAEAAKAAQAPAATDNAEAAPAAVTN